MVSVFTLLVQGRVVCTVDKDSSDDYNKLSNWAFVTAILFGSLQTQHCLQVYDYIFRAVHRGCHDASIIFRGTNKGLSIFPCHEAGIDVILATTILCWRFHHKLLMLSVWRFLFIAEIDRKWKEEADKKFHIN